MVLHLPDSWSNWNLEMLVFEDTGKLENSAKNPLEQESINDKLNPHMVPVGGEGGTLGISGWTRAISAEFCYPILEYTPQITPILE